MVRSLVHKNVKHFPVSCGGLNREYQNLNYELNYVLLAMRMVATLMNVIGKYCCTFFGLDSDPPYGSFLIGELDLTP